MTFLEQMREDGAILCVEIVEGLPGSVTISLDATGHRVVIRLDDQAEEVGRALVEASKYARNGT